MKGINKKTGLTKTQQKKMKKFFKTKAGTVKGKYKGKSKYL